ncbi:MAG: AAA family ATPase [Candidatus Dojkabacteria bacterium]|nr:AAA family ATPase [Candidatus Dojkabacteria bacterium]MDQ7020392.1 AAA family ATPase [Candidatus Dojkabacteria bacterium]
MEGNNLQNNSVIQPSSNASDLSSQVKDEISILERKLDNSDLPPDLMEKARAMIIRLKKMSIGGSYSNEYEPVSEYINWIIQLPWDIYTKDNLDMAHAKESLSKYHYGLDPVKNRILEYLAVIHLQAMNNKAKAEELAAQGGTAESNSDKMKKLTGNSSNAPILCFVGIQGVGKTSLAKSIAIALNRGFMRIPLGGLGGVAEIRGRARGTIDPEPGQIIKALIRTGSMNPLILLDEIDKVSSDTGLRADVMAALLEILDPEQNSTFIDKYLDYPVDLSKCMFITTANNLGGISAALLDRLEVIRFGSYNDNEKMTIAKDYLLPKVRKATGLTKEQLDFAPDVWPLVIRPLGFDAGVRQLERTLTDLARKVALKIVQGVTDGVKVTKENFREFIPEDIGIYS